MFYIFFAVIVVLITAVGFLVRRQQQLLRSHQITRQQLQESQMQQSRLTEALQELQQQQEQLTAESKATLQAQVQSQLEQKLKPLELWEEELSKQETQLKAQTQDLEARHALVQKNQTLEENIAHLTLEKDKAEDSLRSFYEQLEADIDRAVVEKTAALQEENQSLRDRNQQLQSDMQQIYRAASDRQPVESTSNTAQTIAILAQEIDLYNHEKLGIILDLLQQSLPNYQQPSRRLDIITDILENTPNTSGRNTLRGQVKQLFTGYRRMNSRLKSNLRGLGFELHSDNTHYKLHFKGDRRYPIVIPKTSGDTRVGNNITSQIIQTLL